MKRKVLLLTAMVVSLIVPMAIYANDFSQAEVSDTETKALFFGLNGSAFPVEPVAGLPAGWNSDPNFDDSSWSLAFLFQDPAYLDPATIPLFIENGANWVSISSNGLGPDSDEIDSRGVYLYRKTFQVPATARNLSADVGIAADNYGWLYVNGVEVLEPMDANENDRNFLSPPSVGTVLPRLLVCNNVIAAEVQNGCGDCGGESIIPNGPTATIFAMQLNYELPDVVWRPPVTVKSIHKNGSTIPIKFRLFTQEGKLIKRMQDVYLAIHEGGFSDPLGNIVIQWQLGNGVRHMRFAKGEGQYIVNFQTQKLNLASGEYTAVVHDGCTQEALGYIEFQLGSPKDKGKKK